MAKPTLCLDFDGVIHSYSSGWKGAGVIPDPPVPGALPFIAAAMETFTVAIFSSRSGQPGGIKAMIEWLGYWSVDREHGMASDFDHGAWSALQWPTEKPPAMLTIDDRALTFSGTWTDYNPVELLAFQPWNKRTPIAPSGAPGGAVARDPDAPPVRGPFSDGYREGRNDVIYALARGFQWALDELEKAKAAIEQRAP